MLKNHLKITWRSLKKRKVFAFINIIGLALGFGCSILIFLFVNHHLNYDKFHHNSDRIFRMVTEQHRDDISYTASVPPGFANVFRTEYDYAENVAKAVRDYGKLIEVETNTQQIKFKQDVIFAEQDLFQIFNFPLTDGGNNISLLEPNTAVITKQMANKMFRNSNAVGKTFLLDNKKIIRITGVLEDLPKTSFIDAEIFVSFNTLINYFEFAAGESWQGISGNLQCFTLLKPNQNPIQIEKVLTELVKKYRPDNPNVHHYELQALGDIHFNANYGGSTDTKTLWTFSLIGLFLLLMACINFVNIATAQSVHRSKEVGIRKVLGSFKKQLFWQFMTETFIITFIALFLGLVLSFLVLPYFNFIFNLELSYEGLLNLKFFLFGGLLLLLVSLIAGSYPGILLARIIPILALKRKLSQNDTGGFKTRKVLVVAQFSISIILIIATIIISKQIEYAVNSDLGFDKTAMLMVNLPEELELEQMKGLKERMKSLSGAEKITACFASPGASWMNWGTNMTYGNRPEQEPFGIQAKLADEDYLNTFGLELVAGRNFIPTDSIQEIVVNEILVKKLGLAFPDELIGKKVSLNGGNIKANIVGVIADFHDQTLYENINPVFIAPDPSNYGELAVKINTENARGTLEGIEKLWTEAFPKYMFEYNFLDNRVAEFYKKEQQFLDLTKLFSLLAIIIGCLGIYGLISFFVVQKTKEIGIRKVLGGSIQNILVLLTGDFLKLILIAGLIASPIAWYFMNNWLQNFNYRTKISWWVFGLAIGGLVLITLITVSYQAIKAAIANPVKSLRTE